MMSGEREKERKKKGSLADEEGKGRTMRTRMKAKTTTGGGGVIGTGHAVGTQRRDSRNGFNCTSEENEHDSSGDSDSGNESDCSSSSSFDWEEERRLARIRRSREQSRMHLHASQELESLQHMAFERESWKQMRQINTVKLREASLEDTRRWEDSVEQTKRRAAASSIASSFIRMMEEEERLYRFRREMGIDDEKDDDYEEFCSGAEYDDNNNGGNHRNYQSILRGKGRIWNEHERDWETLEARLNDINDTKSNNDNDRLHPSSLQLSVSDIPFPPAEDGKLILVSLALHLMKSSDVDDKNVNSSTNTKFETIARKGYVKAALRWHPDKFQHRILPHIDFANSSSLTNGGLTRELVVEKFESISQKLNAAWEEMKASS